MRKLLIPAILMALSACQSSTQGPSQPQPTLDVPDGAQSVTIAADPKQLGARIGISAVLHTWGSAMTHHPHVHMIVPGGGIAPDGSRWISSRPAFLLPVRVLGKLFRRLFLTRLLALRDAGRLGFFGTMAHLTERHAFLHHLAPVRGKRWVVYAKAPFAGPEAVLAYLSRYTHRVAISNSRLIAFDEHRVTFRYKDYRRDGADRQQVMRLAADEFIRRFLLHVLPRGFVRIRRFGILANRKSTAKLALARELLRADPPPPEEHLDWRTLYTELTGASINSCRKCSHGQMQAVAQILSFQEQLNELRLGGYQPEILLSRVLASNFLKRSQHLENELNSWQPHGSLNHAADPQGIDSS